ncbi:MAG: DUF177 domain-containing protein [Nitrospirota bacterium]|nr:DUF177 domain-containing protein [Nitrospirota bacterium]
MKILIEDIPDEGLTLDIEEKLGIENHTIVSPVATHLELLRTAQEIIINGRLKVDLELQCGRCLKTFIKTLDVPLAVIYHPIEDMRMERQCLKNDEMDMGFYTDNTLDLKEMLAEQILLNLRMKPLCNKGCKGMCPRCGCDLNTAACACEKKEIDPRLEVLKSLLEKRKE